MVVIKFGGSAMENPELVRETMRDVVLMECIGMRPIVVHGGGKAISAELKKQNIPVKFVNGLRHTCERTIKIVDDVLHNQVNRNLVELAKESGGNAIGISGKHILTAERAFTTDPETGENIKTGCRAVVEVGFHSLRYSYISHNAEAGTPAAVIQRNAGHANPAMTEHYTKISDRAAVKYAAALQLPGNDDNEAAPSEPERNTFRALADTLPIETIKQILKQIKEA